MTAMLQTEGLPALSKEVASDTVNYTLLLFTTMLKPTIWSTKSTITKLSFHQLLWPLAVSLSMGY